MESRSAERRACSGRPNSIDSSSTGCAMSPALLKRTTLQRSLRTNAERRQSLDESAAAGRFDVTFWCVAECATSPLTRESSGRIAVALRFGAPICEEHLCICKKCVKVDIYGHHGPSCQTSQGRSNGHLSLNTTVQRAQNLAGYPCRLEHGDLCDGLRPDDKTHVP